MKSTVLIATAALFATSMAGLAPRGTLKGNCVRRGNDHQKWGTCLVLDKDGKTKHIPCASDHPCPDDGKTHTCTWASGNAKCN
ncbi:hypothetical protein VHEMI03111 [[Torrubiella] hemipterigena]|uniref:Antifungal protein n=1 Tax=[Torrubiella] hemipterigena TaxID=1531966 RepID=A0A0A1SXM9_9HYPO|nr:hypothetical protein VHEMI03111 [[Torrubiella] hemipterigena]